MTLRQKLWRSMLGLHASGDKLPKVHARFKSSECWHEQEQVLQNDLVRMPLLQPDNVLKIIRRFCAASPYAGYTQGNLYLVYGIGMVFSDEQSVYWAFARVVKLVHPYGPSTPYGCHVVPQWLVSIVQHIDIGRDMWDLIIRMRWLYIIFGQTFDTPEALLSAWDYCLRGSEHMYSLCAALLYRGLRLTYDADMCSLERASLILGQSVNSLEETADLISQAQLLLRCTGPSLTSAGRRRLKTLRARRLGALGRTAVPLSCTS